MTKSHIYLLLLYRFSIILLIISLSSLDRYAYLANILCSSINPSTQVFNALAIFKATGNDGVGSYTNADQEAGDNSYRYSGANPNNFVCFGSDEIICPEDNLYRIIGVFGDQVKLIKADYANSNLLGTNGDYSGVTYADSWGGLSYYDGSLDRSSLYVYYWNQDGTNIWSESQLNIVNLNQNYLNNIGEEWASKIAEHTWQVGGAIIDYIFSSPVKTAHTYEVGNSAANTTYDAKIGLMYVSEYGYAVSQHIEIIIGCIWDCTNGPFPVFLTIRTVRSLCTIMAS